MADPSGSLSLPLEAIRTRVSPLDDLSPLLVLLTVLLPVLLTSLFIRTVGLLVPSFRSMIDAFPGSYVVYGGANLVVCVGLYLVLDSDSRGAVFVYRCPRRREIFTIGGALIAAFVLAGVAYYASYVLGLSQPSSFASVSSSLILLALLAAFVIVSVVEEILFRGMLLGYFLSRGQSVIVSVVLSMGIFGVIHLPALGQGGVVRAVLVSIPLFWLRLRYDHLTDNTIVHILFNMLAFTPILLG